MSKAIKWQIPFATTNITNPTRYRLDIYAEDDGTWDTSSHIQLTAGETPFVTDEDNNEDFFTPVRGWTGTIEVCTLLPDGTQLDIRDLMPKDNISHPVRLIKIDNSTTPATETVEWQGFMSSEAYSQAYVSIPDNFSFPVISVLEAMDSVEVELSESMAFNKIIGHAAYAMKAIETESGMSLFDQIYLSAYCKNIMTSIYFYNNVYFEAEEQISGDNIVVEVHSISCKKILEQIAKFFGCCWREYKQNLYLEAIGKNNPFSFQSFATIKATFLDGGTEQPWLSTTQQEADMAYLEWMGTNHKRDIRQGARRVKVSAKLKDFEGNMSLEECPVNSLVENPTERQITWGEVYCNTNEKFYSIAEHKHRLSYVKVELDSSTYWGKRATIEKGSNAPAINYQHTWPWSDDEYRTNYDGLFHQIQGQVLVGTVPHYCTSFMAWMRCKESAGEEGELLSGLMICGLPRSYRLGVSQYLATTWYTLTESDYLYRLRTPLIFSASAGHFEFDLEFKSFMTQLRNYNVYQLLRHGSKRGIEMAIKWGNKWLQYDSSTSSFSWSDSFVTFSACDGQDYASTGFDGKIHYDIPIESPNIGFVTIYLYSKIYGDTEDDGLQDTHNIFITKLDFNFIKQDEELRTDRSENVYAENTDVAFRDEKSIDLDIATDANNKKLATMLWSDETTPVKLLSLDGATVRPEVELLNRLATYYGASRQTLDLITKHPVLTSTLPLIDPTAILPLLKLNGIGDGKVYLPLAESRNWKTEECTLRCFESPEEPETPSES